MGKRFDKVLSLYFSGCAILEKRHRPLLEENGPQRHPNPGERGHQDSNITDLHSKVRDNLTHSLACNSFTYIVASYIRFLLVNLKFQKLCSEAGWFPGPFQGVCHAPYNFNMYFTCEYVLLESR